MDNPSHPGQKGRQVGAPQTQDRCGAEGSGRGSTVGLFLQILDTPGTDSLSKIPPALFVEVLKFVAIPECYPRNTRLQSGRKTGNLLFRTSTRIDLYGAPVCIVNQDRKSLTRGNEVD